MAHSSRRWRGLTATTTLPSPSESPGSSREAMWTSPSPTTARSRSSWTGVTSLSHRRCPCSTARDSACPSAQPCSSGASSSSGPESWASSGTSATLKRVRSPTGRRPPPSARTVGVQDVATGHGQFRDGAQGHQVHHGRARGGGVLGHWDEPRGVGASCVHPVSRYGSLPPQEEGPSSCLRRWCQGRRRGRSSPRAGRGPRVG